MRLIDVDRLISNLEKWTTPLVTEKNKEFIEILKDEPTVERPHGEWEVIGRETFSPTVTYRCSVCKAKEVSCVPNDKPHYCENCGARMTGEGDAE